MAGKEGLKSALETVGVGDAPGAASAEQLALLPAEPARNDTAEVLPGAGDPGARRGPGRPAGARNKRTEDWVNFIVDAYGSPLVHLAQTMVADTKKLAKELHIKQVEAFDRQQAAAIALLPYVHQKLPQAIELDKGVTILQINVAEASAPQVAKLINGVGVEIVEDQSFSDAERDEDEHVDDERGS